MDTMNQTTHNYVDDTDNYVSSEFEGNADIVGGHERSKTLRSRDLNVQANMDLLMIRLSLIWMFFFIQTI